jgi:hypothetical protein
MSARDHCALTRANRVFCTDEKCIRTENAVMVNTKHGMGVLYKIADPRGRLFVRASSQLCNNGGGDITRQI